ncbi:MAG TPA: hypothetical protein VEW07_13350 [Solirubrobacterales bacterium]|nr:hypothetical protein [Solirubrobacterales bacterium]
MNCERCKQEVVSSRAFVGQEREAESVTAYDSRDVDPLVALLGKTLPFLPSGGTGSLQDRVLAALAPFDSEEKT